jgi:F-type H+-transporting ATPase subunit epsilon
MATTHHPAGDMAGMRTMDRPLQCVVVTPERAVLDEPADFVALPMYDGELGVLPGRAPLIGRLGYGEMRIRHGGQTKRFFVDGGFAQVRANVVTVLTHRAVRAEEIDQAAATRTLETAPAPAATPEARAAWMKDQERARAQLRVARHGQEGHG